MDALGTRYLGQDEGPQPPGGVKRPNGLVGNLGAHVCLCVLTSRSPWCTWVFASTCAHVVTSRRPWYTRMFVCACTCGHVWETLVHMHVCVCSHGHIWETVLHTR